MSETFESDNNEIDGQLKDIWDKAWAKEYEAFRADPALKQKSVLEVTIVDLPKRIRKHSMVELDILRDVENLRLNVAAIKNNALENVLAAVENGKPKYTNDKARNIAVEQELKSNRKYQTALDALIEKERALRIEQITLEYMRNLFSAYRSVAAMRAVD